MSTTSMSTLSRISKAESTSRTPYKLEGLLPLVKLEGKLESRLTKDDLDLLQEQFEEYETVTREDFCRIMRKVNKGLPNEYAELYDKIDVTREGLIDWDKFASHMLLDFYEKDDRVKSTQVPQWKNLKHLPSPHKETINRLAYVKLSNRYIGVSKEGCVSLWDQQMKLQRNLKITTDTCKARDLWVTHFVLLQNVNKIALAFTSKEIAIYDLSTKMDFSCQYKIHGLHTTPLCLDYWYDPENADEALLVWGDTGGIVNVVQFTSATVALFQRPTAPAGQKHEPCLNVNLKDLVINKFKNAKYFCHEGHIPAKKLAEDENAKKSKRKMGHSDEWVRQVIYSHHLESFISCSTTSKNSLVIGKLEKNNHAKEIKTRDEKSSTSKMIQRTSSFDISQGVNGFDYHEGLNLIATAGVNHQVCLWNPFVVSKPNGVLRGHMTGVVQVQFNKSRGQLMSFSKDKVLRIWDVQLQVCISRLAGMFPKGPEVHSILLFDEARNRLFITFNYQLTMLEMKAEVKGRVTSHDKPIVQAIYNSTYNQVISADQGGTVIMWMLDTGQKVKQISQAHGQSEVTSLAQDLSHTRILTGSTDGTIKIWDMNGHCHHSLQVTEEGDPAEVVQILVLKHTILAVGWAKYIAVFRNQAFKDFHVLPADWKGGQEHHDDVLTMAFAGHSHLASASYDGEIIVWNNTSEQVSKRLSQRSKGPQINRAKTFLSSREATNANELRPDLKSTPSERSRTRSRAFSRISLISDDNSEYSFAVTKLVFLAKGRGGSPGGANLVSCGGNGWVRFWNTNHSQLMAEFLAHTQVSSIIMAIDEENQWLATGDTDGLIKIWDMSEYCLGPTDEVITKPPKLQCQFSPHTSIITSLELCRRNDLDERVLVISASLDCSVALWDVFGNQIGVFGQEEHWKIEPYENIIQQEEEVGQEEEEAEALQTEMELAAEEDIQLADERALSDASNYRINIWTNTVLGKDYQEKRSTKRERPPLSTIPNLPYLTWEKTGQAPTGPFAALSTPSLTNVNSLSKPDFIANPDKYFIEGFNSVPEQVVRLPVLAESLEAAFDEKTLFPAYILDFEVNMKNYHQKLLKDAQERASVRLPGSSGLSTRNNSAKGKSGKTSRLKALPAKAQAIHEETLAVP